MQADEPPVERVRTMCTPLWTDKHAMSALCLPRRKQLPSEDPRRKSAFDMSSPQPVPMNH